MHLFPRTSSSPERNRYRWLLWVAIGGLATGYFLLQFLLQQQRFAHWQREERVRTALNGTAFNLGSSELAATLEEELEAVGPRFPVPIVFDEKLVREPLHFAGAANEFIIIGEEHGTYRHALVQRLVGTLADDIENGICYRLKEGKAVVQTAVGKKWPRVERTYPLPISGPGEHAWTEAEIQFLLRQSVRSIKWDQPQSQDCMKAFPGGLCIVCTEATHDQAGSLLRQIVPLAKSPDSLAPRPLFQLLPGTPGYAAEAALDQPVNLKHFAGTLGKAFAEISKQKKIPILVQRSAAWKLEEAFVPEEEPPATLREFLQRTWSSYRIVPDGLEVTTLVERERDSSMVCYPLHDLVRKLSTRLITEELVAAIEKWPHLKEREEFREQTGKFLVDQWLLVHGRESAHAAIAGVLSSLRKALEGEVVNFENAESIANKVELRLAEIHSFGFSTMPLGELCQELEKLLDCPVECSHADAQLIVKFYKDEEPLGKILDDSLSPHNLTYQLYSDKLYITESHSRHRCEVLYDVRELTEAGAGLLSEAALIKLLRSDLKRTNWRASYAGEGVVNVGGLLLCDNDTSTQWRIRALLKYLRDHQAELPRLAVGDNSRRHYDTMRLQQREEASSNWCEKVYLRFLLAEKGEADGAPKLAE
jgi:hypothetical protein